MHYPEVREYPKKLPIITSVDGKQFEISAEQWQQNKQQHALLLRYLALPLQQDERCLWLAIDNLTNLSACEAFSFLSGKMVEPVLLTPTQLKALLQQLTPQQQIAESHQAQLTYHLNKDDEHTAAQEGPVIRLLETLLQQAIEQKASDIHIEPQVDCLRIRFRIDGVLQTQPNLPLNFANQMISRLKLLAKLDISETRLPQDGRFHFDSAFVDKLDLRLSTLPTCLGEKIVLRLQQNKPTHFSFAELGMNCYQQQQFEQALSQPQGLILVTGPTGSGKSLSLYSALQWLNQSEKHILTAEDPIEIVLDGIIQTQINPLIGLTFSKLLRTFLRQDPDVIMLGEIRDEESAAMAIRAAQTGHLVLSTLHTNDAPSAIARLRQLGIKPYEISHSLLLIVAQRLIRKRCGVCEQTSASACHCYQGYDGRTGIYQFLVPKKQSTQTIDYQLDFETLRQSGLAKVKQGITDLAELNRVLGEDYV